MVFRIELEERSREHSYLKRGFGLREQASLPAKGNSRSQIARRLSSRDLERVFAATEVEMWGMDLACDCREVQRVP